MSYPNNITTWVGTQGQSGNVDGTGTAAKITCSGFLPQSLADDGTNLYYLDATYLRKIVKASAVVTTLRNGDFPFNTAVGRMTYANGFLYSINDWSGHIYKIDPATGNITYLDATPFSVYCKTIASDGTYLYIGLNNDIYRVSLANGSGTASPWISNAGLNGQFDMTYMNGYLYVVSNNTSWLGAVRTSDGMYGSVSVSPSMPFADCITNDGTYLYIGNNTPTIYSIFTNNNPFVYGGVSTFMAGSTSGYADGIGAAAKFSTRIIAMTADVNNIYAVDSGNYLIRKLGGSMSGNSVLIFIAIARNRFFTADKQSPPSTRKEMF